MIKDLLTFSRIYLSTQINVFLFYISRLPIIGRMIPERLYGLYPVKKWFAFGGIIVGLVKSALAANIGLIITLYLIPDFLFNADYCTTGTYAFIYIVTCCVLRPISKCELFISSEKDYCFLNHFMVNPNTYYKYKFITLLLENSVLELPALIWLIRSPAAVTLLVIIRTGLFAFSIFAYLRYYVKRGKVVNRYARRGITLIVSVAVYAFGYYGVYSDFTAAGVIIWIVTAVSVALMIFAVRFLLQFDRYKMLAVRFANNRVVNFRVSLGGSSAEGDTGLTEKNWEKNRQYYEKNKRLSVDAYINKAFVRRFGKPIIRDTAALIIIYMVLMSILGLLVRKGVLDISSKNVLSYSTVIVSLVTGMGCAGRLTRLWFRNIDIFMISNHVCTRKYVMDSIRGRYLTVLIWDLAATIMSAVMLAVFLSVSRIRIDFKDFVMLLAACGLYLIIWETYELAVYYFIQPYSADLTAKSPVFNVLTTFEAVFNFLILFIRANMVKAVILMAVIAITAAVALTAASGKAYRTFKLRY